MTGKIQSNVASLVGIVVTAIRWTIAALYRQIAPDFLLGKCLVMLKSSFDLALMVFRDPSKQSLRFAKLLLQMKPSYTMVRNRNLLNLYLLTDEVNRLNIPGDIVECGVWNGGSAAIMGVACQTRSVYSPSRTLWLFDSFQGLPPPGVNDSDIADRFYFEGWNRGTVEKVKKAFAISGVSMKDIRIIPGWFEETLASTPVESIALLHIDADWYSSVKLALETFYERVVPGGYIVLDDYGYWKGCDRALHDFLAQQQMADVVIERVGSMGAFFRKPAAVAQ